MKEKLQKVREALDKMSMCPEQLRSAQNYTENTDYERGFENACEILTVDMIDIYNDSLALIDSIIAELDSPWQPIKDWEQIYEVSKCGAVRKIIDKKMLGIWYNSDGYALVRVSKPRKVLRVHRLVAEAFVKNNNDKPYVNHINNNPSDNTYTNLEWCTQKENLNHARRQERMYKHPKFKPSPNRKLSTEEVDQIRSRREHLKESYECLAVAFGASKRTIGRIIKEESYAKM